MKTNHRSYRISVSVGKGCYRHIRIDGKNTLYELHESILDAFEFFDDHAHAFFMDNRAWSEENSFYSEEICEEEEAYRPTTAYNLNQMGWSKGDKFVYIFDFGEEWRFGCRVLNVLDEPTEETIVTRSAGEAPAQFEYGEEDNDEGE